jgi:hypothetical protein
MAGEEGGLSANGGGGIAKWRYHGEEGGIIIETERRRWRGSSLALSRSIESAAYSKAKSGAGINGMAKYSSANVGALKSTEIGEMS